MAGYIKKIAEREWYYVTTDRAARRNMNSRVKVNKQIKSQKYELLHSHKILISFSCPQSRCLLTQLVKRLKQYPCSALMRTKCFAFRSVAKNVARTE